MFINIIVFILKETSSAALSSPLSGTTPLTGISSTIDQAIALSAPTLP
jgi:hypothetical protein